MTIGTRLALAVAVLVAAATLLTTGVSYVSTSNQVTDDIDRFLETRVDEIISGDRQDPRDRQGRDDRSHQDGQSSQGDEPAELEEAVQNFLEVNDAVDADAVVQALSQQGAVLATTGASLPVDGEDLRIANSKSPDLLRTVVVDGVDHRMITSHIDGGGAVQVARSLDGTNLLLSQIRTRLLVIGFGLSVVAALTGLWIARHATRPIRQLTQTVEAVAQTQDLSTPIDLDRDDEIGRLANGFDDLLSALAASREQQHQLVQDAAHELRTPLTSIKANVDLLAHAPDLDAEVRRQTLTGMRSELRQLNLVFDEIIELATDARPDAVSTVLSLEAVVASAVDRFGMRADNPVDVVADTSRVVGDSEALERAIDNLLRNAEKFGPPGGVIEVRVSNGAVGVRDRGPGIPPDEQDRIFDRFYRAVETQSLPGSGLGLAIVKKIVTDHSGRVFVGRPDDGGAEVGFVLPTVAD